MAASFTNSKACAWTCPAGSVRETRCHLRGVPKAVLAALVGNYSVELNTEAAAHWPAPISSEDSFNVAPPESGEDFWTCLMQSNPAITCVGAPSGRWPGPGKPPGTPEQRSRTGHRPRSVVEAAGPDRAYHREEVLLRKLTASDLGGLSLNHDLHLPWSQLSTSKICWKRLRKACFRKPLSCNTGELHPVPVAMMCEETVRSRRTHPESASVTPHGTGFSKSGTGADVLLEALARCEDLEECQLSLEFFPWGFPFSKDLNSSNSFGRTLISAGATRSPPPPGSGWARPDGD